MKILNIQNIQVYNTDTSNVPYGYHYCLMVVLTEGNIKDQAVYYGIALLPDYSEKTSIQYERMKEARASLIAHMGDKLTFKQALKYFPDLKEGQYRK